MKYYSTNNKNTRATFKEAVFQSLPVDGGLYMPTSIPRLDSLFLSHLAQYSLPEIGFEVAKSFVGNEIPQKDLRAIVEDAVDFPVPLRFLDHGQAVLELFHGPSYAFKDFGARFMSRVMSFFNESDRLLDVLVATSGDTGGAVALGFLGVPGIRVTILYPKGKVSPIQELQLTTHGNNIRALAVEGTFDDCQAMVKKAFNDQELSSRLRLTSANSINIARLLPQTFYYFYALGQLQSQGIRDVVFSVPSGNFGNLAAGLLAKKMGLPVHHFVAATNANDTVSNYLRNGIFTPKSSVQTLSNAMDVGNPSNWLRVMDLFTNNRDDIGQEMTAYSFTDRETLSVMRQLATEHHYMACPHTAVGWLAGQAYKRDYPGTYALVSLATAHASKFPDVYPPDMVHRITQPSGISDLEKAAKHADDMPNEYEIFKKFLLDHH